MNIFISPNNGRLKLDASIEMKGDTRQFVKSSSSVIVILLLLPFLFFSYVRDTGFVYLSPTMS